VNPGIAGKIQHYDLEDVQKETALDFLMTMLREEKSSHLEAYGRS